MTFEQLTRRALLLAATSLLIGCGGGGGGDGGGTAPPVVVAPPSTPTPTPTPTPAPPTTAVTATPVATLSNPWAMTFLPDGRLLVTERLGTLRVVTTAGVVGPPLANVPAVNSLGQGGLLDVILDQNFGTTGRIFLSYAETINGGSALAIARANLIIDASGAGRLENLRVIWRQQPAIANEGRHYGGRLAFGSDGFLYATAGERYQRAPAQDLQTTIGKIIRIDTDGAVPTTNPFVGTSTRPEIWTRGHRNPYGLVRARDGNLYSSEHGPSGGDEFNIVTRGANYGWPVVSEGDDNGSTPRHSTRSDVTAPLLSWTPAIAPGGLIQYTGSRFVGWDGDFVQAGLRSQGLVRVRVTGGTATEVARYPLGQRIREVELGPDGNIWVLEDGGSGRLLRVQPA